MRTLICYAVALSLVMCVVGENHFFGVKTPDSKLVFRKRIFLEAIPFKKRLDYFDFTDSPDLIKAIYCYDYQNSEATVNCTAGGVGYDHVSLRLKSQRNYRLDFAIEVYA